MFVFKKYVLLSLAVNIPLSLSHFPIRLIDESVSQIYASPQNTLDEYNKSLLSIRNAIGEQEYNAHLFRFPGGYTGGKYANIKQQAAVVLEQNGVLNIDWNALTADSAGAKTTEEFIAELEKTVPKYNSVVVLMHDAGDKKATADALPTIIQYFRDRDVASDDFIRRYLCRKCCIHNF